MEALVLRHATDNELSLDILLLYNCNIGQAILFFQTSIMIFPNGDTRCVSGLHMLGQYVVYDCMQRGSEP